LRDEYFDETKERRKKNEIYSFDETKERRNENEI
jgi:hypothetical protein